MNEILEVGNLEKSYGNNKVVDKLSFKVEKGEIFCLLGPNGAGKSTTINILCGSLGYDDGQLTFEGRDIRRNLNYLKKNLGVVPQDLAIYENLSAEKNVKFFASLYGLKGKELQEKTQKALEFVGLLERKNDKASTFSGGMKRRLNIACAIAHEPELLIMDEPTVGIDPQSRNHILNSIKELNSKGMTILYTTHYMEEVEEISTRILIMDSGKVIAEGTKDSLKDSYFDVKQFVLQLENDDLIDCNRIKEIEGVCNVMQEDSTYTITVSQNIENLDKILGEILRCKAKILNLSSKTASLENVFLKLTGKSLRD